tara:strand:+ start:68 stop:352 length:285 start_codon:yes stop_codon:yes gene_type:complete
MSGPYYIHEDGVQVLTWTCAPYNGVPGQLSADSGGAILLSDGRCLPEVYWIGKGRVWATHPSINPNVTMVDGVWHYQGKSLREPYMGPPGGGEE